MGWENGADKGVGWVCQGSQGCQRKTGREGKRMTGKGG